MTKDWTETVLLVCADEARSLRWIDRLQGVGCRVVGPAPTAAVALMLTSHAAPGAAVLVGPTAGRRDSATLAADLARLWGVPSYVPGADHDAAPDTARNARGLRTLVRPWEPEREESRQAQPFIV
jgi:hypothetical protein